MTLQSGLDKLANLQKLQMLGIESTNNRIGVLELEWIAEHWLGLESNFGHFGNGQDRDPAVVK